MSSSLPPHCYFYGYNSHQSTTRLWKNPRYCQMLGDAITAASISINPEAGFQLKTGTIEKRTVEATYSCNTFTEQLRNHPLLFPPVPTLINDDYLPWKKAKTFLSDVLTYSEKCPYDKSTIFMSRESLPPFSVKCLDHPQNHFED